VKRWLFWWRELLPGTRFWQQARALFMPPVATEAMPRTLAERFDTPEQALAFLAPLTTTSASTVRVESIHAEDGVSR
jgi:Fic family protein